MRSKSGISVVAGCALALSLSSSAHAAITVQNFWHLGEFGGNLPTDSVGGKNFTGQVGNQVANTSVYAPGSTASLQFDGYGGAYMNSPSDGPVVPSDNFVLELWVNPTSFGSYVNLASLGTDTGSGAGWAKIGLSDAGTVFFGRENEAFGAYSTTAIALNAWTHLAYVQADGIIHGYVNGVELMDWDSNTGSHNNNGQMHLGVQPGNNQPFTGFLDEMRFSTFAQGQFSTNDLLNAPVPEPASMTVLGLGALAVIRRRRNRKS